MTVKCSQCGFEYPSKNNLIFHQYHNEEGKVKTPTLCDECPSVKEKYG